MDWDAIAAGARGEGESYEKKRKARAKKAEAEEEKRKAAEKWLVTVTVEHAKVYVSTDSNGLSDPYMEVYVGSDSSWTRIGTTKVCSKTKSPTWDQTFTGKVDGLHQDIKLKLYDKDMIGSDYIGSCKCLHRSTGGTSLLFNKKDNRKVITASGSVSIKWEERT